MKIAIQKGDTGANCHMEKLYNQTVTMRFGIKSTIKKVVLFYVGFQHIFLKPSSFLPY